MIKMKKVLLFLCILSSCAYKSEKIIGYNKEGKTLVQICDTNIGGDKLAYNSKCIIDSRDYGDVKNKKELIEATTFNKNTTILVGMCVLLLLI